FAEGRLDRPNQNCFCHSSRPANCVEAEMVAVNQIDIPVSRRTKHYPIARRRPWRSMAGRIIAQIGLGLDHCATARSLRRDADEPMPEQLRCNHFGRWLVEGSWKRSKPFQAHRLTCQ